MHNNWRRAKRLRPEGLYDTHTGEACLSFRIEKESIIITMDASVHRTHPVSASKLVHGTDTIKQRRGLCVFNIFAF